MKKYGGITLVEKVRVKKALKALGFKSVAFDLSMRLYYDSEGDERVEFVRMDRPVNLIAHEYLELDRPDVVVFTGRGKPFVINVIPMDFRVINLRLEEVFELVEFRQIKRSLIHFSDPTELRRNP